MASEIQTTLTISFRLYKKNMDDWLYTLSNKFMHTFAKESKQNGWILFEIN